MAITKYKTSTSIAGDEQNQMGESYGISIRRHHIQRDANSSHSAGQMQRPPSPDEALTLEYTSLKMLPELVLVDRSPRPRKHEISMTSLCYVPGGEGGGGGRRETPGVAVARTLMSGVAATPVAVVISR